MHDYYATQSATSDPDSHAHLFDNLAPDLAVVSRTAQGLIYHYMAGQYIHGYCPPSERMSEIDTRDMEQIIGRILEMDDRPLSDPRSFENRFVGCCRDFSLMSCAILRQHGLPARLRYGFGNYFIPGYWIDHVIVEAWDGIRWQRFDPQITAEMATFNVLDMPDKVFVTGGRAWQMYRNEGADPAKFGLGPNVPELSGEQFIAGRLMLDMAALNKRELLCWDTWGVGSWDRILSAEDKILLDQVAELLLQPDVTAIQDLFVSDDRLCIPDTIISYSPAQGQREVRIS